MERLIFRTWIERYKEFKYWGFVNNTFIGCPTGSGLSIDECRETSNQWTGLLDKEGKQIFSGDLLEFWYTPMQKGAQINTEPRHKIKAEVIFKWGMFCLKHVDGYENKHYLGGEYEIVGNIFENKDWKK